VSQDIFTTEVTEHIENERGDVRSLDGRRGHRAHRESTDVIEAHSPMAEIAGHTEHSDLGARGDLRGLRLWTMC